MSHIRRGGLVGVIVATLLAALAAAADAVPVSVRIVGDGVAVERAVDTTGGTFGPNSCAGDSAGGAIDKAVDGNWDRMAFVSTILGETHTYANRDYWSFWINDTYSQLGICDYVVKPADRVLVFGQRDTPTFTATVFPLGLSDTPSTVVAGAAFTVAVKEFRTDGATTTPTAVAGATVSGGGASAQTDAAGRATLVLSNPGSVVLRATRSGNVASDAATVNVVVPAAPSAPAAIPPPCSTSGRDGLCGTRDLTAPAISIRGGLDGGHFGHGKGPRRIKAVVDADPAGLLATKLRLTRTDRGRCSYFSGKFERFKPARCGAAHGFWFRVGDQPEVDYLLPGALPRGRYVLDANVVDKAYNRDDARRRGGNRVVFHVG